MNIKYFNDTDTLYIQFNENEVAETMEMNENVYFDIDEKGNTVSITLEHAKKIANINSISYQLEPEFVE